MESNIEKRIDSIAPSSRDRFQYLDALRGLAALLVVARHSGQFWGFLVPRSYLAVDLFFLLSGFVIANAYDQKLAQKLIGVTEFMKIRLIRLYPLFALSLMFAIIPFALNTVLLPKPILVVSSVILTIVCTAFLIPSRFTESTAMFAINGPYWSLFFELVTNFIYAWIRPALSDRLHFWIVIAAGVMLAVASLITDTLNIGLSTGVRSFVAGLIRATFGIFFGLLLFKFRNIRIIAVSKLARPIFFVPFCVALFFVPIFSKYNGLIDFIIVSIALPFTVLLAAKAKSSSATGLMVALGTISYPIYVFHQPFAHLFVQIWPVQIEEYAPYTGIALAVVLSVFALFSDKYFDVPTRKFLTTKLIFKNRIVSTLSKSPQVTAALKS